MKNMIKISCKPDGVRKLPIYASYDAFLKR